MIMLHINNGNVSDKIFGYQLKESLEPFVKAKVKHFVSNIYNELEVTKSSLASLIKDFNGTISK
jgi:hypothetical protein